MTQWSAILYGFVALAYGAIAAILVANRPRGRDTRLFSAAIAASSLWAAGTAILLIRDALSSPVMTALDAARLALWTACILSWLPRSTAQRLLFGASCASGLLAFAASWSA